MVYSYFEEYLYLVRQPGAKSVDRDKCSSIEWYAPVLRKIGVDLNTPAWRFMVKATRIRHCLLHANGWLVFMANPPRSTFEAIVAEYPGSWRWSTTGSV